MKVKYVQEHISSCSGTVGTYVDTNLRTPPSASSLRAHAGIGGSGRWPGWGRYPGAFRERGCNLRPARQRKDGANRDTDGGRNQQHSYSAHYYLYPTDGGFRFGSLTTSRSIQMLNNQLSGLYSNLRNDGQRCLPHPWWRDAHELGPEASALRRFNRAIERQGQESRLCPGNEGDVIDVGPEGMKR
jgi:hypothetical protein